MIIHLLWFCKSKRSPSNFRKIVQFFRLLLGIEYHGRSWFIESNNLLCGSSTSESSLYHTHDFESVDLIEAEHHDISHLSIREPIFHVLGGLYKWFVSISVHSVGTNSSLRFWWSHWFHSNIQSWDRHFSIKSSRERTVLSTHSLLVPADSGGLGIFWKLSCSISGDCLDRIYQSVQHQWLYIHMYIAFLDKTVVEPKKLSRFYGSHFCTLIVS